MPNNTRCSSSSWHTEEKEYPRLTHGVSFLSSSSPSICFYLIATVAIVDSMRCRRMLSVQWVRSGRRRGVVSWGVYLRDCNTLSFL